MGRLVRIVACGTLDRRLDTSRLLPLSGERELGARHRPDSSSLNLRHRLSPSPTPLIAAHRLIEPTVQVGKMSDSPEVAILQNDAALHSLKRPQLLALTKRFGLKGSGKVRSRCSALGPQRIRKS